MQNYFHTPPNRRGDNHYYRDNLRPNDPRQHDSTPLRWREHPPPYPVRPSHREDWEGEENYWTPPSSRFSRESDEFYTPPNSYRSQPPDRPSRPPFRPRGRTPRGPKPSRKEPLPQPLVASFTPNFPPPNILSTPKPHTATRVPDAIPTPSNSIPSSDSSDITSVTPATPSTSLALSMLDSTVRLIVLSLKACQHLHEIQDFTRDDILPEGYAAKIRSMRAEFAPIDAETSTLRALTLASENWMKTCYTTLESHYSAKLETLLTQLHNTTPQDPKSLWTAACLEAKNHIKEGPTPRTVAWVQNNIHDSFWNPEPPLQEWRAPLTQIPVVRNPQPILATEPLTHIVPDSAAIPDLTGAQPPAEEPLLLLSSPPPPFPDPPVDPPPTNAPYSPARRTLSPTDSLLLDSLFEFPSAQPSTSSPISALPPSTSIQRLLNATLLNEKVNKDPTPPNTPSPQVVQPSVALAKRTVHYNGGNKKAWTLDPTRPILILGDSNVRLLPIIGDLRVQVDSYPGASMANAIDILSKLPRSYPAVRHAILSLGFNNRQGLILNYFEKLTKKLYDSAVDKFPKAVVCFPLIAFSPNLPPDHQVNLRKINQCLQHYPHIPALPADQLLIQQDNIHWDPQAGDRIWQLWQTHLD